jgi:hypothetical protein
MLMNTLRNYHWSQRLRVRAERAGRPAGRQRFPQAVYWRRRVVALLVAMAVLSLITWAFFGALGLSAGTSGAPAGHRGASPGGAPHGGSGPGAAGAGGALSGNSQSPATKQAGSGGGRRAGSRPRACAAGDVVLSLLASQAAYSSSRLPQFSIDVVGTGQPTCTFNVGARHVALVIRSGSVRVWSSADCPRGSGSLVLDLQRGVPTTLSITWNRQTSSPGCTGPSSALPAGTYSATVVDGGLDSNPVTFRLGG